jgi:hypothetical protein
MFSPARRLRLVLFLVCALMLQSTAALRHQVAMLGAGEVCSASGPLRVDADGHPIDDGALHDHSCCWAAPLAPPPPAAAILLEAPVHAPPTAALGFARLAAAWIGPLGRGPPRPA